MSVGCMDGWYSDKDETMAILTNTWMKMLGVSGGLYHSRGEGRPQRVRIFWILHSPIHK